MNDITDLFLSVLNQAGSVDIAEAEFKKMIGADEELHQEYREWCHVVGNSERHGFVDFCDEYLNDREEVWNNLSDYDE
jgi:hypothetical protein